MSEQVKLKTRPSRDGQRFVYRLEYKGPDGKRRRISIGHCDKRRAEGQRKKLERSLRAGIPVNEKLRLRALLSDHLERTRNQVRESSLTEQDTAMRHFIEAVGNIDIEAVRHEHGERFIQTRLDAGDSFATVRKKIAGIHRIFELAVRRGQMDENPFRYVQSPRGPQQKVNVYTVAHVEALRRVAPALAEETGIDWPLLLGFALSTAMRRGEILNTVWRDIDFDHQTVHVGPKDETEHTWAWRVKDTDRRTLPLTPELVTQLAANQAEQTGNNPYVFIPVWRYERIQGRRRAGNWAEIEGRCPLNGFDDRWNRLRQRAGIDEGTFHDLRRTCLSNWLAGGLSEYEVMRLAGHADFETTHKFYLSVRGDLVERARAATAGVLAHTWHAPAILGKGG